MWYSPVSIKGALADLSKAFFFFQELYKIAICHNSNTLNLSFGHLQVVSEIDKTLSLLT